MRDKFQQQISLLEQACRELHERPDDHALHDAVLSALAAMGASPHNDDAPLVRGLANMVVRHASILEDHLKSSAAADHRQIARAAAEGCKHIADLKDALERH